ncbi:hypothetical protein CRUP_002753 [Coryphaenoides rupestris]|nr:hypothetical protein CRUP_002753 [Coryphaenoides rupestris]
MAAQKLFRLEALVAQAGSHDFGQAGSLHYEAEELRQQCVLFLQYVKVFLHRYLEVSGGSEDGPAHPYEEQEAQLPSALLEELFGLTLLIGRLKDLPASLQGALSMQNQGKSFWSYMNQLLQPLVAGAPPAQPYATLPAHCKDPLGFTWWLGTLAEDQVRMHVHCCLSLSLLWGPSTAAVSTMWDYYSRNLSASFSVPWLGVCGLGSLARTPLALLGQARSCCSPDPVQSPRHAQLYRSATSFHVFLRVLGLCLAQDSGGGAPRRQMKGRIYSKFSAKKMQDLSEAGLMNFLLLFLVVACRVELEDVAGRACELLAHLRAGCPPGHRTLERGLDVGAQAGWLASSFNQTAKEFYNKTTEASRRLALWGPLASYLEGVAEVFETSAGLGLSEEKLLSEGFDWLLPACRQSELHAALGFLQVVLSQLRCWQRPESSYGPGGRPRGPGVAAGTGPGVSNSPRVQVGDTGVRYAHDPARQRRVHQRCVHSGPTPAWATTTTTSTASGSSVARERHLAVAAALWAHFFPFLRSLRLSQTPPPQLADAAAGQWTRPDPAAAAGAGGGGGGGDDGGGGGVGFTLLAFDLPGSAPHDLQPSPVRELVSALSSSGSGAAAVAVSGSAQALSVRAWFRCVLQQHLHKNPDGSDSRAGRAADEQLAELTRLVLRLPDVEALLQRAGLQPPAATRLETNPSLELFIKAVGRVYAGLQVLSERAAMVGRALEYLGDVLKHIKPYLVSRSPEGLQLTYWAVGCVVKHWSPLLATSKAQQLLFRIVDGLLLPHHQNLAQHDRALRASLPLYLQGLSVAAGASQSQGVYLKQQLCAVIGRYLDHFLPATATTAAVANHPVLLAACEASPSPQGAALRRTTLQVLCDRFLQFKGHAPPPRLPSLLAFLLELLRRGGDADPPLLTVPLPSLLRCLMLVNEPHGALWRHREVSTNGWS